MNGRRPAGGLHPDRLRLVLVYALALSRPVKLVAALGTSAAIDRDLLAGSIVRQLPGGAP